MAYTALLTIDTDSAEDAAAVLAAVRAHLEASTLAAPSVVSDTTPGDTFGPESPAQNVTNALFDAADDDHDSFSDLLGKSGVMRKCPCCGWRDYAHDFQCGDCGLTDGDLAAAAERLNAKRAKVTLDDPVDILERVERKVGEDIIGAMGSTGPERLRGWIAGGKKAKV